MTTDEPSPPRRPRDLALLLLAAGGEPPRQRARDQQADRAGAEIRRRVLDRLAALDPEPEDFEATLARIVAEFEVPFPYPRSPDLRFDADFARIAGDVSHALRKGYE